MTVQMRKNERNVSDGVIIYIKTFCVAGHMDDAETGSLTVSLVLSAQGEVSLQHLLRAGRILSNQSVTWAERDLRVGARSKSS